MKYQKHFLGDTFTLLQCGFTARIFVGAFVKSVTLEVILVLFALAELCDALDGPCARRWQYPKDGKFRWWRTYASEIDKITDLMTGLAMITYTIARVDPVFGWLELIACTTIGLIIQFIVYDCRGFGFHLLDRNEPLALSIIHVRRFVYVVNILSAIDYLIWHTIWPQHFKITLTAFLVCIGLGLLIFKKDRLHDR